MSLAVNVGTKRFEKKTIKVKHRKLLGVRVDLQEVAPTQYFAKISPKLL